MGKASGRQLQQLRWETVKKGSGSITEPSLTRLQPRSRKVEKVVLPGLSVADGAVSDKEVCQFLGFAAFYGLVCDNKGLVSEHTTRGQPPKLSSQVRYVVEFTSAENNSCSEVQNFLESIKIFLRTIAINCQAVLDAGNDECRHEHSDDAIRETVARVGEANQQSCAPAAELGRRERPRTECCRK